MTPSQRKQLLQFVSSGLDVEAGAAQIGLPMSAVRKAGAKLALQLEEAYATGSARLRGRLLKAALTENDLKVIQNLLEQRAISAADKPLESITRIIINPPCPKCGHIQPLSSVGLPPTRTAAAGNTPDQESRSGEGSLNNE